MASSLPTESALDKTVETFGLGAYDLPQSGFEHGEDSNKKKSEKALPDDGGPLDPFGPDRLLSYPTNMASAMMPGDVDRPPSQMTPPPSHLDSVVHSVSQSRLPPQDSSVARADYYDSRNTASLVRSLDDMFSNSGDDTYTSSDDESLPSIPSNYSVLDNNTQSLGNYWSGKVIQDQAEPAGFPSTEFEDPARWQKTNASEKSMIKTSTDINLVKSLTTDFLKAYGKNNLTRRHIMSFLKSRNSYQYLASDIIRCLNHDHEIVVRDVLDQFPVYKKASGKTSLASIRDVFIELEILNITKPEISSEFRYAAAEMSRTIALLEKLGVSNGR